MPTVRRMKAAAKAFERLVGAENLPRSHAPDSDNKRRVNRLDLRQEPCFATRLKFSSLGRAVVRWAALYGIGYEHIFAAQPRAFQKEAFEKLAGTADEWSAMEVFFCAGRLAH